MLSAFESVSPAPAVPFCLFMRQSAPCRRLLSRRVLLYCCTLHIVFLGPHRSAYLQVP